MIELDMQVTEAAWSDEISDLTKVCERALEAAAALGHVRGEVSLLLTDDDAIQALNRDWRGKDKPTDVLSFPASEMDRPFLGDIAVSFGVSHADATNRRIGLDQHLSHLLIHGLFHLLGHDHKDDTEAAEMERLEIAALASLGWPDPYI